MSTMFQRSNEWRVNAIQQAVSGMMDTGVSSFEVLQQEASSPLALGFSTHDLQHFREYNSQKLSTIESMRSELLNEIALINKRASFDGGRLSAESRQKRDGKLKHAHWCSSLIKALNALIEAIDLEHDRRASAMKPVQAATPAVMVIEQAPTPAIKAVSKRAAARQHKAVTKQPRCSISLSSLNELKEYFENTALALR